MRTLLHVAESVLLHAVSSYRCLIRLDLSAVRPDLQVEEIQLLLNETRSWKSPTLGGPQWTEQPRSEHMLTLKDPMRSSRAGAIVEIEARLPKDSVICQSTLKEAKMPFIAKHDVICKLVYSDGKGERFVAKLAIPVELAGVRTTKSD